MEKIIVILWILFGIYMMVLVMILADLWSGVAKAKKKGVIRSSYGFRRTVEKTARYFNLLLALTVIDAMQVASIWYLETFYNKVIPMFPFITLLGAIGVCLIELKSIYEKSDDKVRFDQVGGLAQGIIKNKDDYEEIIKIVANYMKSEPPKVQNTTITIEQKEGEIIETTEINKQ